MEDGKPQVSADGSPNPQLQQFADGIREVQTGGAMQCAPGTHKLETYHRLLPTPLEAQRPGAGSVHRLHRTDGHLRVTELGHKRSIDSIATGVEV
jgi:hypothetical protein